MLEALTLLSELSGCVESREAGSILWKATESLDYASLLISLAHVLADFSPEVEVEDSTDVRSALNAVEGYVKNALSTLEIDPKGAYTLLKKALLTLRTLRRVA